MSIFSGRPTTIYRWVQRYGPELDKRTRWYRRGSVAFANSWRVDETYIRAGGKWCYLYRAVTKDGRILDFYMSTRRNTAAATRFLGKALRSAGHSGPGGGPRVICTDKAPTYPAVIEKLIKEQKLSTTVRHRQVKYLNNVIEGDHGRLKRILGPRVVGSRSQCRCTGRYRGWRRCTRYVKAGAGCSLSGARTRIR